MSTLRVYSENTITLFYALHGLPENERMIEVSSTREAEQHVLEVMHQEWERCNHQVSCVTRWSDGVRPGLVYLMNDPNNVIIKAHFQRRPR